MWNAECCLVFFSPSGVFPWASLYVYVDQCGLCHAWIMKKIPRLCVRRQFRSVALKKTCTVQAVGVVDLPGCVSFYTMLAISKRWVEENVYCAGTWGGWPSWLCILHRTRTISYHPMSNGFSETWHRSLHTGLSHYTNCSNTNWDTLVPFFLMAYCATPNSVTGYCPFYLLHGREMEIPNNDNLKARIETGKTRCRFTHKKTKG